MTLKSKFREGPGGKIWSTITGEMVVRVPVENLTTDEAKRMVAAVLAGLDAEYGLREVTPTPVWTGSAK